MKAKNNVDFYVHTLATINVAKCIVEKYNIGHYYDNIVSDVIKIAAFHDLGKCVKQFQDRLMLVKSNNDADVDDNITESTQKPYRHNEVSAAVYTGIFGTSTATNPIIRTILNHHPHTLEGNLDVDHILEKNNVSKQDLHIIRTEIVPKLCNILMERYNVSMGDITNFDDEYIVRTDYIQIKQIENVTIDGFLKAGYGLLLSSIIIYADRLVSEDRFLTHIDDIANGDLTSLKHDIEERCTISKWGNINDYINNFIKGTPNIDMNRLKTQTDVANNTATTLSVALPTGNGKTLPTILTAVANNKRGIIVSPEISVTLSNNNEIDKLITKLGLHNTTISLMKSNKYIKGDENSDFQCINIDSLLNFIFKNSNAKNMLSLFFDPIIFDEWHILCENDNAVSTLFTIIMWIRHNITKAHTLLLSATPINSFFDLINTHNSFNSEKVEHYIAPSYKRDNKYKITALEITKPEELVPIIDGLDSALVRVNSHKQASLILHGLTNPSHLYSNMLTEQDSEEIMQILLSQYSADKHNTIKPNIITTTKGEKSLNYSCKHCVEFIKSPIDTIQTLGRAPRCKTEEITNYYAIYYNNKRSIEYLGYPAHLARKWFEMLKSYDGQIVTEQDIYNLYNDFENSNREAIRNEYLIAKYNQGVEIVNQLSLVRMHTAIDDNTRKLSTKITLRGNDQQVFVSARIIDTEEWCQPIAIDKCYLTRPLTEKAKHDIMKVTLKHIKDVLKSEGVNNSTIKNVCKNLDGWDKYCDYASNEKYALKIPYATYSKQYGLDLDAS